MTDKKRLAIVSQHLEQFDAPLRTIEALGEVLVRHGHLFERIQASAAFGQLPASIRADVRAAIAEQFHTAAGEAAIRGQASELRGQLRDVIASLKD